MSLDATTAEFLRLLYPQGMTPSQYPTALAHAAEFQRWRKAIGGEGAKVAGEVRLCAIPSCGLVLRSDNHSGLCSRHVKNAARFREKYGLPKAEAKAEEADRNIWHDPATHPEVQGAERARKEASLARVIAAAQGCKNGGDE